MNEETDYKALWEYTNERYTEVTHKLKEAEELMDSLKTQLADAKRERDDARNMAIERERACIRLQGQVDAFEFCVRYYMSGGD